MDTMSSVSSSSSTAYSLRASIFTPQPMNRRVFSSLPLSSLNPKRQLCIGIGNKDWSFRPKAALRENSESIGVPTSVPVRVAHELLQAGHRYLDVRTPEEFSAGHAVGAINIPYMYRVGSEMARNPKFLEEVPSHFGKFDEIIVGCQLGKRSMMAATDLLAAGYTGVTDIAGGFAAWRQNELPVEF